MLCHSLLIFLSLPVIIISLVRAEPAKDDWQSHAFHSCCVGAKMGCAEMCEYPPPKPGFFQQLCLMSAWNEYLNCYTQQKNNTECCVAAGVTGGDLSVCLDMCHGEHAGEKPSMAHGSCGGEIAEKIAKCNKANRTQE